MAAAEALALESDFERDDGKTFGGRDAAIDAYVRMCRKRTSYRLGPYLTVNPDYYPLGDGSDRYCIGFTLYVGNTEIGKLTGMYTDDVSAVLTLKDLCITLRLDCLAEVRGKVGA